MEGLWHGQGQQWQNYLKERKINQHLVHDEQDLLNTWKCSIIMTRGVNLISETKYVIICACVTHGQCWYDFKEKRIKSAVFRDNYCYHTWNRTIKQAWCEDDEVWWRLMQCYSYNLTQWVPTADHSVSELGPAAVVLQHSDDGGRWARHPTQPTQLREALPVLADDAHQSWLRINGNVYRQLHVRCRMTSAAEVWESAFLVTSAGRWPSGDRSGHSTPDSPQQQKRHTGRYRHPQYKLCCK